MRNSILFLLISFTIFILLLNVSCKDNSVNPSNSVDNNFSVKVVVKNSNAQPMQGIRVSAYNTFYTSALSKTESVVGLEKIQSASIINYTVKNSSLVTFAIYELDGRLVQSPIINRMSQPGIYSVIFSINSSNAGTRVYKGILTAINDTTQKAMFKDSIYLTLWQPDPNYSVLGYTSNTGTFETADSLAFPNVLILPQMIKTYSTSPDPVGTFSIPQNVVFTLTDTTTLQSISYTRQVVKGQNAFDLPWTPSIIPSKVPNKLENRISAIIDTVVPVFIPMDWKLFQNYPNPFN
jgi:hypothetical protein